MSVLGGFYSTWDNARQTFGAGTPHGGAEFDGSAKLNQLGTDVGSAAPGSRWNGTAASAYGTANTDHGKVFGQLAGLDQRLGAQIDQSAEVVAAGRRELDAVRKWVADAAASVPPGKMRDQMLMQIVQKGTAQIAEIIQRSNGEMNSISGNLRGITQEFQALTEQKFGGPKEGGEFIGPPPDEDPRRKAEQDVQDALTGDQDAAARVEDIIGKIKPGQELSPEQASYLSQMQAQQYGMSVEELHTAEQRLGDHKDIIGDSWQLMSNDDVRFPHTATDKEALDDPNWRVKGAFENLPQSVQDSLRNADALTPLGEGVAGLTHDEELRRISQIVKDGDQTLQTGTELDREMLRAADKVMDTELGPLQPMGDPEIVQDIFDAAGRDHQIVHDHLLGTHDDDGDDFLHDINRMEWTDDGKAAASLVSWTNESHSGPEADIAGATAEKYASYIGAHKPELMDINGQTVGELSPELVKGYAHGLTPYMADLAGLSSADPNNTFDFIDREHPVERPIAKGIFSVLSTEASAYNEFHSAANAHIIASSHGWAEDVKHGIPVSADDSRLLDCATLKALETVGTTEAAQSLDLNKDEVAKRQEAAYNMGVKILSEGAGLVPGVGPVLGTGIDVFGSAMQSSILGEPPNLEAATIQDMDTGESARFALNALLANDVQLNEQRSQIDDRWLDYGPIDPDHPERGSAPYIKTLTELQDVGVAPATMQDDLTDILEDTVGTNNNPAAEMKFEYDDIVKNPNVNEPSKPGE